VTEGHASIGAAAREGNNLLLRIAAALVMAPLAIAIAYAGGWLWTGLVTVAAIGLYAEWLTVTGARNLALLLLGALVLLGAAWIESGHFTAANVSIVVALGVVVATIFSSERRSWAGATRIRGSPR
jgi:phosphatidate cytidylyltransferase